MSQLTHLSLFSGIGGLDLAAEWAGFQTVGQCEFANYPYKILCKHWPNIPKWRDIRELTGDNFYERTGLRTVDIISGGFPCQPFSVAGKQKGKDDDRYLWPEMLRVIRELAPRWVIGENVSGIINIAGRTVCEDLEREGYAITILNFEAAAVGALHRRERVFFVANAKSRPRRSLQQQGRTKTTRTGKNVADPNAQRKLQSERLFGAFGRRPCDCGCNVSNANIEGLQGRTQGRNTRSSRENSNEQFARYDKQPTRNYWSVEPNVGRVANGIPARVDRLKCLGNAVVPQQAYPIFAAIHQIESED